MNCQVCHSGLSTLNLIVGIIHPNVLRTNLCKLCGGPNAIEIYGDGCCINCFYQLDKQQKFISCGEPPGHVSYITHGQSMVPTHLPQTILLCSDCCDKLVDLIINDQFTSLLNNPTNLFVSIVSKTFGLTNVEK